MPTSCNTAQHGAQTNATCCAQHVGTTYCVRLHGPLGPRTGLPGLQVATRLQTFDYRFLDGSISARSCVTSLIRSTHEYAKALDDSKQLDAVYLDFSKASDSVSCNCLLGELHSVGINGNLLRWFRRYLTNRRRRTVIDGEVSA